MAQKDMLPFPLRVLREFLHQGSLRQASQDRHGDRLAVHLSSRAEYDSHRDRIVPGRLIPLHMDISASGGRNLRH